MNIDGEYRFCHREEELRNFNKLLIGYEVNRLSIVPSFQFLYLHIVLCEARLDLHLIYKVVNLEQGVHDYILV